MKHSYLFIFFLFIAKLSTASYVDTLVIANADELIKLGLKNNSNIKIYKLKITQSNYDYKASNYFKTPQINGTFNSQYNLKLSTTNIPGAPFGQPGKYIPISLGKPFTNSMGISQVNSEWIGSIFFNQKLLTKTLSF